MNVLLMLSGLDGVNYHRLAVPYMDMARNGLITLATEINKPIRVDDDKYPKHITTKVRAFDSDKKEYTNEWHSVCDIMHTIPDYILKEIDVCVFNRNISPTLKPEFAFQRLKKFGIKVICDMDDSPVLNSKHVLKSSYNKMNMEACVFHNCIASDAITCTTHTLKNELQSYIGVEKKIVVIKNAIDKNDTQFAEYDKSKYEAQLFGWMGSITHFDDLKLLSKAYKLSHKPKLSLIGTKGDRVWDKVMDLFDGENVVFQEPKPVHAYSSLMYDYDIMLIPLLNNKFNRCKSELKMLEAAALGKAVIVSDVYPYKNLIQNGRNCIAVKNTPEDWANAIDKIAKNKEYRDYLANNLMQDVDKLYNLENENKKRRNLLLQLCK